jgi:SAM-dependent methyltransferase
MVFSIDHLHQIRSIELNDAMSEMPLRATVLEIGAGTGAQAKRLSEAGFSVTAIDLPQSNYATDRVFPVADYDGRTLPVDSGTIDVVFSSNVLEHVRELSAMHSEIRRVLKPSGFCLHIVPSTSWRFWTTISGWLDVVPAVCDWHSQRKVETSIATRTVEVLKLIAGRAIPRRHGEHGFALSELWTFSRRHWIGHFEANGFAVEFARPMGLFYTGYMLLGSKLSRERRQHLSGWLGSACNFYRVRPRVNAS